MPPFPRAEHARAAVLCAAVLAVAGWPTPARADGILEGISGDIETIYSLLVRETTDAAGTTTKTETSNYRARTNLRLNYNLLPKINLDARLTYERELSDQSGDTDGEIDVTNLRPSVWLTLRDPVLGAALGYDLRDETVKVSGSPATTLTRETYAAHLTWRPADLPWTQFRYTRTRTVDDPRASLDTTEDQAILKSEYRYGGLQTQYTGTYLRTDDAIQDAVSSQLSHEGNLLYATTFLDGRISLATDNRVILTELEGVAQAPLFPFVGLSALDDTPLDGPPLASNSALIDGNTTASAGVNIGFPGAGGDFTLRNVGIDFLAPVLVDRLRVWVDGWGPSNLPADITNSFSWDVYTSRDNVTWTFHARAQALFPVFERRFELSFPPVTTRYIKVVTRPLPGGVIISTNSSLFPSIFITELQSFVARTGPQATGSVTQILQNYNLDLRVLLLRSPSLFYRFNVYYFRFDPGTEDSSVLTRYTVSNGLFLNHRFNPIFSTTANASVEVGTEEDETRKAILYYATLAATPVRTLTNTLAVSGNLEWVGATTTTNNSVVLYNVAQLYRGIDVNLNLGAAFTSDDPGDGETSRRRDLFLSFGAAITPHPALTMTTYYSSKLSHASGSTAGGSDDRTEHRLDLGLSFTPFPTLALSAGVDITSETGEETKVRQNYGLTWAPFPDGRLQFSFYYAEDYVPDFSRIIQPTLRWYFGAARRSYLEASYQFSVTESDSVKTESHLFSTGLRIFF